MIFIHYIEKIFRFSLIDGTWNDQVKELVELFFT